MRVVWKRDLDGYYGSAFFGGGTRLHVVAEMLPDAGWDWVAWSNDDPGRTLNGRSCTREVAIRQAEQAGRVLAEGEGAKSKAA
jgi:hypothetical protein